MFYFFLRLVCWFTKGKHTDYFGESAPKSIEYFIYHNKTNHLDPCYLYDYASTMKVLTKNFFVFGYDSSLIILRNLITLTKKDIFQHRKPYLTESAVLYLSKKIKKDAKKDINN